MHERWRIELFGGLRASYRDLTITRFRTRKTALLLAYLALYREQVHAREVLLNLLWPESELAVGSQSLRTALTSLRHHLELPSIPTGSALLTPRKASRATVGLSSCMAITDVAEFEVDIQPLRHGEGAVDRIPRLKKAVELYHGGLLPGFYAEWVQVEQRRLERLYVGGLDRLALLLQHQGAPEEALAFLQRILAVDQTHEETLQRLIRGYAQIGEQTLALRQCETLEQATASLGTTPTAASLQLIQAMRGQSHLTTTTRGSRVKVAESVTVLLPEQPDALPLPLGTLTFLRKLRN